jgi:lysophospholipase L1-like esterase
VKVFDVAFTGTSLTSGRAAYDWKLDVQRRLQPGADREIRFYDLGLLGQASTWGLANIHHVANTRAKVAIIEFSMNDAFDAYGITLEQSDSNTRQMIQAIRSVSPNTLIYLMTMNPVAVTVTNRSTLSSRYAQYRTIAASENVGLIDNEPLWGTPSAEEIPDGVHPVALGQRRVLIPNVVATLQPLIATA